MNNRLLKLINKNIFLLFTILYFLVILLFLSFIPKISIELRIPATNFFPVLIIFLELVYSVLIFNAFGMLQFYNYIYSYINKYLKYFSEKYLYSAVLLKTNQILEFLYDWPIDLKNSNMIYFMFYISPKIIVSLALFLDVVYINKIYYLYIMFGILWVPILFHIMMYILNNWADIADELVSKDFVIEKFFDDNNEISAFRLRAHDPQNPGLYSEEDCEIIVGGIVKLKKITNVFKNKPKNPWIKYINLQIYNIFFILYGYRLYLYLY